VAKESERLMSVVDHVIEKRKGAKARSISPSWVATEALLELDPKSYTQRHFPDVWIGCHLELRQLARASLRARFEPETEDGVERAELFPDLQPYYPTARKGEEPLYVVLEDLSDDDVAYNVARLRSEAGAKLRHADALEAWGASRPKPEERVVH
jgi:hypothetical protein